MPSGGRPGGRPVGVLTTGRLEERVWQRFAPCAALLRVTAGAPAGASAALQEILREDVSGLVSFGVAAGLAPAVQPGRLVVADAVVLPDGGSRATHEGWRQALLDRLRALGLEPLVARLAGAETLPGSALDRTARFRATVAAAQDSESHLVAEAAHAHGLPFVVVRVVVDDARDPSLGTDLLVVNAAGRWRRGLASGLLRPWQVAKVMRGGRDLELGLQVLARALPAVVAPPVGPGALSPAQAAQGATA